MKVSFTKALLTAGLFFGLVSVANAQTYCSSYATQAQWDSDIIDVQLGSIQNNTLTSACAGYTYYSGMSTDLVQGDAAELYIQLGVHNGCGSAGFTKSARAWIDFNQDGDFDDAGEVLGNIGYASNVHSGTITFNVPCTAVPGTTRMRVSCQETSGPNIQPCAVFGYGEVEDYNVNIVAGTAPSAQFSVPDSVYTGCVTTFINSNQAGYTHQWFNSDVDPTLQTVASTNVNYNYTFPSAGSYTIRVSSTNCQGTAVRTKTVTVIDPTSTPVANFVSSGNQFLFDGDPIDVSFYDLSLYGPTSWHWTITPDMASGAPWFWSSGGAFSQNPSAFFWDTGTYEVCLTVENALGSSAPLCHTAYINIGFPQSSSFVNIMGDQMSSALDSGWIYDSGGPTGPYQLNEYNTFTIAPCGADEVTLYISQLDIENNWDHLYIYDGPDVSYPQIADVMGTNLPGPITASSGAMTLLLTSDGWNSTQGFAATWSSVIPQNGPVTADFSIPDTIFECSGWGGTDLDLLNATTGVVPGQATYDWIVDYDPNVTYPAYYCDFCMEENPTWTVPSTGQYEEYLVRLVVMSCEGNDTMIKTVRVSPNAGLPVIDFNASNQKVATGGTITLNEDIKGGCDLEWVITPATGWAFENGYDAYEKTTVVKFTAPGSYHVELISSNDNGTNSLLRTNYIDVIDYCSPTVALPTISDVGINNVKINGIDNTTPSGNAPGYTNYVNDFSTTLTAGQTYDLEVSRNSVVNPMNRKAWIDFNRDGIFQDPTERVMFEASANTLSYTATFTVPDYSYTYEGESRLRIGVSMANGANTPCGPLQVGEYEDYGIVLKFDDQPPVITMNGNDSIFIEVNTAYNEQGAVAIDNLEGNISGRIVINNYVVTTQAGIYYVTYDVTDGSGLNAQTVVRTVIVSEDLTSPIITLTGASTILHSVLVPFNEPGYSAIDNPGNVNVTANVTVAGNVDWNAIGDYDLVYEVYDINGNYGTVTRTVQVRDLDAPVITSPAVVQWQVGTPFVNPVTITDNFDPDFETSQSGTIDVDVFGEYDITFYAKDFSGNVAIPVTVKFDVDDYIDPVIQTLQGSEVVTIQVNDINYFEPPVTALDNYYPNTSVTRDASALNIYELGSYPVIYTATDGSGNTATFTRTINVVDTERPTIIAPVVNVKRWSTGFDPMAGVIAVDNYWSPSWFDSNGKIEIILNTVDINYPGLYNIVYRATDGSGNVSAQYTRVVNVYTPTGLNDVNLENSIQVYPNPSMGVVNVKLDAAISEGARIVVLDILGNTVYNVNAESIINGETRMDLSNMAAGVYLVQVNTVSGSVAKRIVINK